MLEESSREDGNDQSSYHVSLVAGQAKTNAKAQGNSVIMRQNREVRICISAAMPKTSNDLPPATVLSPWPGYKDVMGKQSMKCQKH